METTDVLSPQAADASVRPATAADLAAIGAVHARAWRAAYGDLLGPQVLAALLPEEFAEAWTGAVTRPPSSRHRVLVACSGPTVVGFCASAPDDGTTPSGAAGGPSSPDAEIVALLVDPLHQRRGHASRLLAATVERCRDDGVDAVRAWSPADDGPRREFLASAGFGPDGTARELALPGDQGPSDDETRRGRSLREVRLVAALG